MVIVCSYPVVPGLSGLWKAASGYGDSLDPMSSVFVGAFGVIPVVSSWGRGLAPGPDGRAEIAPTTRDRSAPSEAYGSAVTRAGIPTLGRRGEGWVVAQSVAVVAIVVAGIVGPRWPDAVDAFLIVIGIASGTAGIAFVVGGVAALGGSLSPYPRPPDAAELRDAGAYRLVRHPIYGGLLLLASGWSLLSSPVALVATAGLLLVFELKSRVEESMLAERFPEYRAYRARVRWRFVPGVR